MTARRTGPASTPARSSPATPSTGQRLVTGDAVNVAARLEQAAPRDEILIGESTYRLVRDAVEVEAVEPLELKGKAERVPAYRLLARRATSADAVRRDAAPLVGRDAELARARGARSTRRVRRSRCRLVTLSATPASASRA